MKKLVINKNKNQLIRENRINPYQTIYLLINSIIDIAEQTGVDSDFVNTLKRLKEENYKKLKEITKNNGSKILEK
jgi:hypothetical protein